MIALTEKAATKVSELITAEGEDGLALRVAVRHRVGEVRIGEASVVIAAAAAHRPQAFDACRAALEALKATAPLWKKEHYADGAEWVTQGG